MRVRDVQDSPGTLGSPSLCVDQSVWSGYCFVLLGSHPEPAEGPKDYPVQVESTGPPRVLLPLLPNV